MAEGLNRVGFVTWFANGAAKLLAGLPVTAVLVALVALLHAGALGPRDGLSATVS
jgi:di/tricarboxylate transporter